MEAIACWCEAVHGSTALDAALSTLCQAVGAQSGIIVRTRRQDGQQQKIAVHDPGGRQSFGTPLRIGYAHSVFDADVEQARAGTVWREVDARRPKDGFLQDFQKRRNFAEFVTLVLSTGPVDRDHIELHFRYPLLAKAHADLAGLAPTLARTWASRRVGLVSRLLERARASDPTAVQQGAPAILSTANPARLSRSEYRVCLMLSRGLSTDGISAELGISEATIRSHLRSIYAKTHSAGRSELLFKLLAQERASHSFSEARHA